MPSGGGHTINPVVREATRKSVQEAMSALGYIYNRSAAGLRASGSGLIGLIINDLRNPFFVEFASSLQMALLRKGYATVIANSDEDPEIQAQVIESMIQHGVSAFVISPAYGAPLGVFDRIERAGIPAMLVLRKIDDRVDLFPFASPDYAHGGACATRHLLEAGCRSIAFVGGIEGRPITLDRMAGYRDVLAAAGHESLHFPGKPSRQLGRAMAFDLNANHPHVDAALCFSDLVALGMLSGFAEAGVTLGREFRLVGFDDIEECSLVYPKLSSVRCNTAALGADIATAMFRWIDQGERPAPLSLSPVELVARQSSAPE